MQTSQSIRALLLPVAILCVALLAGCKKTSSIPETPEAEVSNGSKAQKGGTSNYNLEVVLRGAGNRSGHIHFRQDPDEAKIITLDTKVRHLLPDHDYVLQRAVDVVLDGQCSATSQWLTLGYGLVPHSLQTDRKGKGHDEFWRDVTAIPSGSVFDIHFRVVDPATSEVVLDSDCYQYTVR